MKSIRPDDVDDIVELQLLANNNKLGSYPNILSEYIIFRKQYAEYITHAGNPWNITPLNIEDPFRSALIRHYDSPPKGRLKFIDIFRRTLSPTVCPMCGGFGNGTLDHYLPKIDYPEYSFFSKNLIPACNCNSLRGLSVRGTTSPGRAIHPYFDNFLNQRLYQSAFSGDFETPAISIEVIDNTHPEIEILLFHLEKVIKNDATQGWFEKYWSELSTHPYNKLNLVLPSPHRIITTDELTNAITLYRNSKDIEYDTPNNWYSIFYTGLMNDHFRLDRLTNIINAST